ncbi:MAG: MBL fold metallo-hydrolase [Rhodomicrobium sp.]
MRPFLHPHLVNGRAGDPALYIETLFERQTILFDLGDLAILPPRKIHRLEHIFVSHTHIDHFIGFDRLLRVLAGREKKLNLYGPPDFIEQVRHKLQAYRWNLVDRYVRDLVFCVTEVAPSLEIQKAVFRLKNAFVIEPQTGGVLAGSVVCSEPRFRVSTAALDHGTPCLAFAVEESAHVNVWKTRLLGLGLQVGPWLKDLKRAIVEKRPDDHAINTGSFSASQQEKEMPLGTLRSVVTVTPGQKIAYVTDAADTAANRAAIIKLVENADVLFIEAAFSQADASLAAERAHLTAAAAGDIAREAAVRRIEPFHFSPRYAEDETRLLKEALTAFAKAPSPRRLA